MHSPLQPLEETDKEKERKKERKKIREKKKKKGEIAPSIQPIPISLLPTKPPLHTPKPPTLQIIRHGLTRPGRRLLDQVLPALLVQAVDAGDCVIERHAQPLGAEDALPSAGADTAAAA